MKHLSKEILSQIDFEKVNPKALFALQRLIELLDSTSPFYYSAALYICPEEAASDALSLLGSYEGSPYLAVHHLISALRRFTSISGDDPIFNKNDAGGKDCKYPATLDAINKVKTFLNEYDRIPKSETEDSNNTGTERSDFLNSSRQSIKDSITAAHREIKEHYKADAYEDFKKQLSRTYTSFKNMRALDRALTTVAVNALFEGKSPITLVQELTSKEAIESLATIEDFDEKIHTIFFRPETKFDVAIVFDHTSSVPLGNLPSELTGIAIKQLKKGHIDWPSDNQRDGKNQEKLEKFCSSHWSTDQPSKNHNPKARNVRRHNRKQRINRLASVCVLTINAWDAEAAREKALNLGEFIADLANAKNRAKHIGVKRKTLVLDTKRGRCSRQEGDRRTNNSINLYRLRNLDYPSNALRFASKGKSERSGTYRVLCSWIAIESFFSSSRVPQNRVISTIPVITAGAANYGIIRDAQTVLRITENYREPISSMPPENIASTESALSINQLKDYPYRHEILLQKYPLFIEYRLHSVANLLRSANAMNQFVTRTETYIRWGLERAAHLRNQTVHEALTSAKSENSLAFLCTEVLNSLFETISILDIQSSDLQNDPYTLLTTHSREVRKAVSDWRNQEKEPILKVYFQEGTTN